MLIGDSGPMCASVGRFAGIQQRRNSEECEARRQLVELPDCGTCRIITREEQPSRQDSADIWFAHNVMASITRELRPSASLVPALDASLLDLTPVQREFLRISVCEDEDELRKRLLDLQERSYERYPYPCIRFFHFVSLFMSENAVYQAVLKAGRQGNTVLIDVGCCMGTDVRKLVADGYPAQNVIGTDLRQDYIDQGYELYQDKGNTSGIRFFAADIFELPFDSESTASADLPVPISDVSSFQQLRHRVTHIYTGALFHLFDEATQYAIALRLASLLDLQSGAKKVIFGRHSGLEQEGMINDKMKRVRYGHSPASWTRLWEKVLAEVGWQEGVEVQAEMTVHPAPSDAGANGSKMMWWSVTVG
ncbi:hypothetical protein BJ138DRAFT_1155253 [Hygrophoropsis aurantiaca]|uniref:Uncharacterized protein n=1 Tax=Hygrophoropsis aurantiaca TaxID=72124 RepID=A0ACB8A8E8_9AGAM|nr:hypothetical protein BJ138DRAFT_1155253 [Hygrophoropsis aurantiaca]